MKQIFSCCKKTKKVEEVKEKDLEKFVKNSLVQVSKMGLMNKSKIISPCDKAISSNPIQLFINNVDCIISNEKDSDHLALNDDLNKITLLQVKKPIKFLKETGFSQPQLSSSLLLSIDNKCMSPDIFNIQLHLDEQLVKDDYITSFLKQHRIGLMILIVEDFNRFEYEAMGIHQKFSWFLNFQEKLANLSIGFGFHIWEELNTPKILENILFIVKKIWIQVSDKHLKVIVNSPENKDRSILISSCFMIYQNYLDIHSILKLMKTKVSSFISYQYLANICVKFHKKMMNLRSLFKLNWRSVDLLMKNQVDLLAGSLAETFASVPVLFLTCLVKIKHIKELHDLTGTFVCELLLTDYTSFNTEILKIKQNLKKSKWGVLYKCEDIAILSGLLKNWLNCSVLYLINPTKVSRMILNEKLISFLSEDYRHDLSTIQTQIIISELKRELGKIEYECLFQFSCFLVSLFPTSLEDFDLFNAVIEQFSLFFLGKFQRSCETLDKDLKDIKFIVLIIQNLVKINLSVFESRGTLFSLSRSSTRKKYSQSFNKESLNDFISQAQPCFKTVQVVKDDYFDLKRTLSLKSDLEVNQDLLGFDNSSIITFPSSEMNFFEYLKKTHPKELNLLVQNKKTSEILVNKKSQAYNSNSIVRKISGKLMKKVTYADFTTVLMQNELKQSVFSVDRLPTMFWECDSTPKSFKSLNENYCSLGTKHIARFHNRKSFLSFGFADEFLNRSHCGISSNKSLNYRKKKRKCKSNLKLIRLPEKIELGMNTKEKIGRLYSNYIKELPENCK